MKKLIFASIMLTTGTIAAHADEPPQWMTAVFPEQALDAAWQEYQVTYQDPEAAIDPKTKQLIAIAVAAQIPCDYCTFGHTEAATKAGASQEEIKEAVAVAAQVRKLSTMLNGMQYDIERLKAEVGGEAASN